VEQQSTYWHFFVILCFVVIPVWPFETGN